MPEQLRRRRINYTSLLTEDQIRAGYKLYCDAELSTGDLGRLMWKKLGYGSEETCTQAFFKAFRLRKWKLRDRSESRKIVMARKGFAITNEQKKEKRRQRYEEEMGRPHQPMCKGFHQKTGDRCKQPARLGSTHCAFHMPVAPEKKCKGTTRDGVECKRRRNRDSDYCAKHKEAHD